MSDLAKLVIALIGIFSLVGSVTFYLTIMSGAIRIYNGEYNATQELAQAVSDEVVSTIQWNAVLSVLIVIASALGLTTIVATLKKV